MRKLIRKIFAKFGLTVKSIQKKSYAEWDGKLPVETRFEPFEITFLNHTLYIHDRSSFLLGYFELFKGDIYNFVAETDSPYIIDCGANMGMSIIYFKKLYPKATIVAFEADTHIYSFLKKNVASFGFTGVTILHNAVWDNAGETLSFLSEGGAGGRVAPKEEGVTFYNVDTVRLKSYLNKRVDFLKVDIEGAEYRVIFDCAEELKNVQTLFLEYHSFFDNAQQLGEMLNIVKNAGFRYHIKEEHSSPHPFLERKSNGGMDLQLNIFCYR